MGPLQRNLEKNCNKDLEHVTGHKINDEHNEDASLQSDCEDESLTSVRENYSEEACMDFIIYELGYGSGIPQDFRYAQGIDQVRTRLMLRYGDRNLDRAMGIFNEILENRSASGLGDDGDVWRSWRHSHTHCRDDLSNPGTPRFSGMVIPAPKPRARHGTRADVGHAPLVGTPEESPQTEPRPFPQGDKIQDSVFIESLTPVLHQKTTIASVGRASEANKGITDAGGFPWGEIGHFTFREDLRSPRRIKSRRLVKHGVAGTNVGHVPVIDALGAAIQALPVTSTAEPKDLPSRAKIAPLILDWNDGYQHQTDDLCRSLSQTWTSQATRGTSNQLQADFEARVNQATHSKDVTYDLLSRQPILPSTSKVAITQMIKKTVSTMFIKDSKSRKPTTALLDLHKLEKKGTKLPLAIRRHANLPPLTLDGACDEKVIDNTKRRLHNPLLATVAKDRRCSRISSNQRTISREQKHSLKLLLSSSQAYEYAIKTKVISRPAITHQSATHSSLLSSILCLRSCSSMLDNNPSTTSLDRDLPSSLVIQHSPLPNEVQPHAPFPPSRIDSDLLTDSTLCSVNGKPTTSSKENFRNVTTKLLSPTHKPPPKPSTKFPPLDPKKYNPGKKIVKMKSDTNRSRYEEIMSQNPFYEEPRGRLSNEQEIEHANKSYNEYHSISSQPNYMPRAMYHSQSESDITYNTNSSAFSRSLLHSESFSGGTSSTRLTHQLDSPPLSPERRWLSTRTPSPTKRLPDLPNLEENEELSFPTGRSKRSRSPTKQMFGEKGWLNPSPSSKDTTNEQNRKTGIKAFGGKIKQRMGDLTDATKRIPNMFSSNDFADSFGMSTFAVSLDAQAQSKLLTELELMICTTANAYLKTQKHAGRMSVDSLIKILKIWRGKGRPQVLEFHFDQLTQRDLVMANIKTFRFYGPNAENQMSLLVMMQAWESMAKDMSTRTFCTPDFMIKKHMSDSYKILEMLGAPLPTFLALQDIQIRTLNIMREEQRKKDEREALKFGVERRFEPPTLVSNHSSPGGSDRLEPVDEGGFF